MDMYELPETTICFISSRRANRQFHHGGRDFTIKEILSGYAQKV